MGFHRGQETIENYIAETFPGRKAISGPLLVFVMNEWINQCLAYSFISAKTNLPAEHCVVVGVNRGAAMA